MVRQAIDDLFRVVSRSDVAKACLELVSNGDGTWDLEK